jgi:hypothetical protein
MPGEEQARAVLVEQTGPLEQAYDLVPEQLLGGRGADVRHAHPLAGGGPAAAGDERVNVRMDVELIPERLRHRDHTGAKALLLAGRHGYQLADGLPGRVAERTQELAMMHEVGAKELREGEHPLGVADVGDDLVLEEGRELGRALGAAGRTEPPPFARESQEELGGAVEVPRDHPVEDAAPEAVTPHEEILPDPLDGLEQGLEQRGERGLGRPAGPVDGGIHERGTWQTSCRGRILEASAAGRATWVVSVVRHGVSAVRRSRHLPCR